jgi:hypothetical protein
MMPGIISFIILFGAAYLIIYLIIEHITGRKRKRKHSSKKPTTKKTVAKKKVQEPSLLQLVMEWSPPTPVSQPLENFAPIQTPPESQPTIGADSTDSVPFISQSDIDNAFVTILQKIVTERGFSIFENHTKCKSLLQDYTAGEYKRESRLLLLAIEAGCPGEIARSSEPEITRGKLINKLHNEFSMDINAAEQIVDVLYGLSAEKDVKEM